MRSPVRRFALSALAAAALLGVPAAALAGGAGLPVLSGAVSDSSDLAGATAVAVAGNIAYTTAYAAGQLTAVDVSNPGSPVVVGSSAEADSLLSASNIAISGGYAYVVSKNRNASQTSNDDGTGNSLTILDIHTNPAHPSIVGTLTDAKNLFGAYGVAVSGTDAYVAAQGCLSSQPCPDPTVGNSFAVIDVSNPASPTLVAVLHNNSLAAPWTGTNALEHVTSVAISGTFAYVTASYSNRLTVIDIANPADPAIVASLQDATNLRFPVDVAVQGGYAYIADQGNSTHPQLTVVNISTPAAPVLAGTLANAFLNGAYRIRVSGPFAYVAGSASTAVSVIDVSNPAAPVLDAGIYNPADFSHTTGLALDSTGQHLVVTSPITQGQTFALFPPFPGQPGGPTETGTVSVLTLDPQPAAVSITASSEPPASTSSTTAAFQFQTSDNVESVQCKLDGGAFGLCTTPTSEQYTALALGAHTFTVQGTDSAGNLATASYTWTVASGPANSAPPTVTGTAVVGDTLAATVGTWSGTPAPTFTYVWNRCTAAGASCTPIGGATGTTYALTSADVGSTLDVDVTATNSAGAVSVVSQRTGVVLAAGSTPTIKITKLSVATTHGKYVVRVKLNNSGPVTIVVRRGAKPKHGAVQQRISRLLPAGASTLKLTFRTRHATTYNVVATSRNSSKHVKFKTRKA
jgi:hypothetical protein